MKVQIINGAVISWGEMPNAPTDNIEIFENGVPDDFSLDKYNYTPLAGNAYNPSGFSVKSTGLEIDFATLQARSEAMYEYMLTQLGQTAAFRTFCADVDALNTQYLTGSLALVAFIRSQPDAIWGSYSSTTGFVSKLTYRGTPVNGVYPRQIALLNILNP